MKLFKNILVICVLLVLFNSTCKKESGPIDYFPNHAGNNWTYNGYDSIAHTSETLRVSVIESKQIDGIMSNVWVMAYPHRKDTIMVNEGNDTIIFIGYNSAGYTRRMYVVPFSINESWEELESSVNQSKVLGLESVTVEAGHFDGCYVIARQIFSFNYALYETIYFKPFIGIIKIYTKERNLGPYTINTWELKSYNL